jgi:phage tail sheath protein FI
VSTPTPDPGVHIQELPSPVHPIAAVATSITAFVGYTPAGIDNRAEAIFSFADFERKFGGLALNSELSYAVQQFYLNGGSHAYVVRVPMHEAVAASVTLCGLTFTALSSGSWANGQLLIDVDVQNVDLTSSDPLAFNLTITDLLHETSESFPNVTLDARAVNYVGTIVNDRDNGSQLVNVTAPIAPSTGPPPPPPVAVTGIVGAPITPANANQMLGGTSEPSPSVPGTDGVDLPDTDDLIGNPAQSTGIYALQKVDQFNLLSIPDATRALPGSPTTLDPNVDPVHIYGAAIQLCDARRAFLLVDPPPSVTSLTGAVDWKTTGLGITDSNGAAFWPRLRVPDALNNGTLRSYAPSGVVAGVYATTDASSGVWKAPGGTQAPLNGVQGTTYQLSDAEQGQLNPLGLNCFRTFPGYGNVVWGERTLAGADAMTSQWKYVPVRRTALFLEESVYRGTQWVVFEPNDEPLWAAIRLNVGAFMQTYFLKGAFQGMTPNQAYFVKCDGDTTTPTDIRNGVVHVLVGFAPLKPAEFVVIQIEQLTGQASA